MGGGATCSRDLLSLRASCSRSNARPCVPSRLKKVVFSAALHVPCARPRLTGLPRGRAPAAAGLGMEAAAAAAAAEHALCEITGGLLHGARGVSGEVLDAGLIVCAWDSRPSSLADDGLLPSTSGVGVDTSKEAEG